MGLTYKLGLIHHRRDDVLGAPYALVEGPAVQLGRARRGRTGCLGGHGRRRKEYSRSRRRSPSRKTPGSKPLDEDLQTECDGAEGSREG